MLSDNFTIDETKKKIVLTSVEEFDLTDEVSIKAMRKNLKKELGQLITKVKGHKARAEQIKALLVRLDTATNKP